MRRVSLLEKAPPDEFKLRPGDILFSHINSIEYIGNVAQYWGPYTLYHGMNLMLIRYNECIDPRYLFFVLRSEPMRELSRKTAKTAVNQASINTKELAAFPIPLPPLPEQKRIAKVLDDVDRLIENLGKRIAKKRLIKKGIAQELLTGKKRLPGFVGAWKTVKLGEYVDCLRGVSYDGDKDVCPVESSDTIRLLRSNNIQEACFVDADVQYVKRSCAKQSQVLRLMDIMVCMANGSKDLVGKSCLFRDAFKADYTFGAFMGCLRATGTQTDMEFIFQLMNSDAYAEQISLTLAGSSINNLRPSNLLEMKFQIPKDIAEQRAIAKVLSDMDEEIANLEARQAKLKLVKKGMLQDLLTGKVRLK